MKNILLRMAVNEYVRVVVFTDNTILNIPVEKWPYCDALIAFYSKVLNNTYIYIYIYVYICIITILLLLLLSY